MEPLRITIGGRSNRLPKGHLILNGQPVAESSLWGEEGERRAIIRDRSAAALLISYSFVEIGQYLFMVTIPFRPEWGDEWREVEVICNEVGHSGGSLHFVLHFDLAKWARPYSAETFARTLMQLIAESQVRGVSVYEDDFIEYKVSLVCEVDVNAPVREEINAWGPIIRRLVDSAHKELVASVRTDTLVEVFNFPPEVRTACEQYLLYFAQFLADLGINAEVNLNHQASQVLFSVTPTEGSEALERISEALTAYLRIPTDPAFAVEASKSTDIAVLQLRANVSHLEGQLNIAQAVLQAKDATIQALELSNFRLQQMLPSLEIGNPAALHAALPEEKSSEPIIEGVVSVQDIEVKGVVVHTAEIVRKLKRRFGKDE